MKRDVRQPFIFKEPLRSAGRFRESIGVFSAGDFTGGDGSESIVPSDVGRGTSRNFEAFSTQVRSSDTSDESELVKVNVAILIFAQMENRELARRSNQFDRCFP